MKRSALGKGLLALLVFAANAYSAPLPTPNCTSGTPASLSQQPDQLQVFPVTVAPGTVATQFAFYVRDAAGNPLRNAAVDFALPASAPNASFGSGTRLIGFTPSTTPTTATATTDSNCVGIIPLYAAGAQAGSFSLTASVRGAPGVTLTIPVTVAAAAPTGILPDSLALHLAAPGRSISPPVWVTVGGGAFGLPVAGVPVTFTAPASGPSLSFGGGGTTTVAYTNAFGVASADAVGNNSPGLVQVNASVAGGASVVAGNYVVPGPLQIVTEWPVRYTFGEVRFIGYRVLAPWFPCGFAAFASGIFAGASATISADGIALPTTSSVPGVCTGGVLQILVYADATSLIPGDYEIDELYGAPGDMGLLEARAPLEVQPDLVLDAANGAGPYQFAVGYTSASGSGTCANVAGTAGRPGDVGFPPSAPPGVDLPYGVLRVDVTNCSWSPAFDLLPVGTLVQQSLLGTGAPLAENTEVWAWGPSRDNGEPHWYRISASIAASFARFDLVDGGPGDDSIGEDRQLHATLALARPAPKDFTRSVQDLWWVGPQENGWGMSLTQHGDRLFAALFIYDASGAPTWLVMPDGAWNADHTQYNGKLYRPHGSAYIAYDARSFSAGPPVGTLKLAFDSADALTLDYVVDGVSGRKSMQRQLFGPPDTSYSPAVSDLWWGGVAQNGWGLAIAQQYATLFGVFFTYDTDGNPTWFVLPTLRGNGRTFTSSLYRTRGAAWLGTPYDPSHFSSMPMGNGTLSFDATGGSMSLEIGGQSVTQAIARQPF